MDWDYVETRNLYHIGAQVVLAQVVASANFPYFGNVNSTAQHGLQCCRAFQNVRCVVNAYHLSSFGLQRPDMRPSYNPTIQQLVGTWGVGTGENADISAG
ncbi:hypothetical protein Ancab_039108 [Ancistrocladus abbreviatus]